MRRMVIASCVIAVLCTAAPSVSFAATLSTPQVNAVLALLTAFGVDQPLVARVEQVLGTTSTAASSTATTTDSIAMTATTTPTYVPPDDSVYPLGGLGYDLSFTTSAYPVDPFGFAVIGVSGGRAFHNNARLVSEYTWAQNFATRARPTFYLNVNAPYGSTATNARVESPRACATPFGADVFSASAGGTYPEPAPCAGYNYGYNTAVHAYAYAESQHVQSPFWWLDIEEANSWSSNTSVNDATIQGVIDYLNTRGIRVGIYSMPYMWRNIAGAGFVPTQTINGKVVSIPNWFPVGTATRVQAINSCHTAEGFITGSPVWIIQYEVDKTAVDQNIAC